MTRKLVLFAISLMLAAVAAFSQPAEAPCDVLLFCRACFQSGGCASATRAPSALGAAKRETWGPLAPEESSPPGEPDDGRVVARPAWPGRTERPAPAPGPSFASAPRSGPRASRPGGGRWWHDGSSAGPSPCGLRRWRMRQPRGWKGVAADAPGEVVACDHAQASTQAARPVPTGSPGVSGGDRGGAPQTRPRCYEEPRCRGAWEARRREGREGPGCEDEPGGAAGVGAESGSGALGEGIGDSSRFTVISNGTCATTSQLFRSPTLFSTIHTYTPAPLNGNKDTRSFV